MILASATPALESMQLAEAGVYRKIDLPARFGGATLPEISIVNLCNEEPERGRWLAPRLVEEMKDAAGEAASNRCCSSTAAAMPR